ncbi:hypothetical protein E4U21_004484 [Claviceps maximensis]|nr:hypothetical protein E4U21_004484 [Claviceps maximensis]
MPPRDPLNPYKKLYDHPAGPGDARPTAQQVLADCTAGTSSDANSNPWAGRVVLLTGGTAGIGLETVRALYRTGADIFFTARNLHKADAVRTGIMKEDAADGRVGARGRLEFVEMDLDSLDSVRGAAAEFLSRSAGRVNVLINNAGIMCCPKTRTRDGHERHFAVNHLAHYLLTRLLLPALEASSTPAFQSRVVNVSSSAHRTSPVRLTDPNFEGGADENESQDAASAYDPWVAYAQSKTALIWTANYLDRVYGPRGVHANSLHPGGIVTGLMTYLTGEEVGALMANERIQLYSMDAEQGAATTVWAAAGDVWEGKGGKFLAHCAVAEVDDDPLDFPLSPVAAGFAYDAEGEEKLWRLSARLVGVTDE